MILLSSILHKMQGDYRLIGEDLYLNKIVFSPIDRATKNSITFYDHSATDIPYTRRPIGIVDEDVDIGDEVGTALKKIVNSKAAAVICKDNEVFEDIKSKTVILVENPRFSFMNLVNSMHHEPSYISNSAVIGQNVVIGKNVSIGPNSVIGMRGFGYRRNTSGVLVSFPQIGRVVIKDNVDIHANVCIDRGALGDTIIGAGTKIDNLVHVAHNVEIGKNCVIVAKAMIGGSVKIGDNSWIAPSASILNEVRIGKNCVVGMGAVVIHDVPDNTTVKGVPAK